MAADEGKLKFLPRHLQRSQPASTSKSKRRVTVEDENAGDEESDRRSVFERLGPGGPQRNEKPKFDHTMKGRSKNDNDKSPDNLRLKFKGNKDKESKMRSQVVPLVAKKSGGAGSDDNSAEDSDNWSIDNLEDKKERELEQKRQEIQRALEALDDGDDAPVIDSKKSDSSESDSSPERPHRKKKDKVGKKKEKKRHKKVMPGKEVSVERGGKRKHGSDAEDTSLHKKKKKKMKERKHIEEAPPPQRLMSMEVTRHSKPAKGGEPELYEPESPTSSTPRADSPEVKSREKRKKKKAKMAAEISLGKSKKLLSPLKKVLKLKKGPASVTSSKISRSESRDSLKRKLSRSRSSSSSSSDSSSESPGQGARGGRDQSADTGHDRGRVKSKSLERRRKQPQQTQQQEQHHRHHRSASSSSSSSSSSESGSSSEREGGRKLSKGGGNRSRPPAGVANQGRHKRSRSPVASAGHKVKRAAKRKRATSADSWNRSKDRKVGGDTTQRQGRQGGPDVPERGRQRGRQQEENKLNKNLSQPTGRAASNGKTRAGEQSKERQRRGGTDASRDRDPKDRRNRNKTDRSADARKDESRDRSSGGGGSQSKDRDRGDDRGRRMGGGGNAQTQQTDRGGRLLPRNNEAGDRRSFGGGDTTGRVGGNFPRADMDRGAGGGRMGRDWEDRDSRREGGGEWESGREVRSFGGLRDEASREFGRGGIRRDGGREERLLPHLGGGMVHSGSQEMLNQKGQFGLDRGRGGSADGGGKRDRDGSRRDSEVGRRTADSGRRDGDSNRRDADNGRRDDNRGRGRDDASKTRGGDRDSKPSEDASTSGRDREARERETRDRETRDREARDREMRDRETRDRETREREARDRETRDREARDRETRDREARERERSERAKGRGSPPSSSSRAVTKLRSESVKEDSPSMTRGESSLAAVFDQTETTRGNSNNNNAANTTSSSRKRPTKTFGGKKSPKKGTGEARAGDDKSKLRLGGRAGVVASRSRRLGGDRKSDPSSADKATESGDKKATPTQESVKEEERSSIKKDVVSKEKPGSQSPRGSQKSADSHSRSSRRSSHSPGRESARDTSNKSRSPGPASTGGRDHHHDNKDRIGEASRGRRKEEVKRGESERVKSSERSKARGRSHTPSDSEVKQSPKSHERARRKSSDSIESLPAKLDGGDIAAAMLGDILEDGQQDVFSDWSDDDDTFNNIIDVDPRKNQVEDLDNHHQFDFAPRGRRDSPGHRPSGVMMLGVSSHPASLHHEAGPPHHRMERPSPHHHHHHHGAGRFHGDEIMPSSSGGHDEGHVPPRGHLTSRGQMGPGRMEGEGRGHMEALLSKPVLEKNIPDVKIVEDVQMEKPARERRRRNTGEEGYEEISSDENDLDEEGERVPKRTIVSILDIDMSSLVQTGKSSQAVAPLVSGRRDVFRRYKACSVFSQLGLSRRFAGEELFAQVQEVCQKQLEQEEGADAKDQDASQAPEASTSVTAQPGISSTSTDAKRDASAVSPTNLRAAVKAEIKDEPGTKVSSKPELLVSQGKSASETAAGRATSRPLFKLYGDLPADHVWRKARAQERTGLLGSFGLFRRALTARKDLDIRRQLCRIDSKYDQSAIYPSGMVDPDMVRLSLQLIRQKRASVLTATVG